MNRRQRLEAARHTLSVLESGEYSTAAGSRVSIRAELHACLAATTHHDAGYLAPLVTELRAEQPEAPCAHIEVANETTLQGIARLHAANTVPIGVLNFASARNPGGGFQSGSQAQEESLARSSGLYASLMRAWPYYERNRIEPSLLYCDDIIHSPQCPVFRDDDGALLAIPRLVTFLTCAAPNAGAVHANQPGDAPLIAATLQRRAEYVLALAAAHRLPALVLGAWGCGVFRNDPAQVAHTFHELLFGTAQWARHFTRVLFSVFDASPSLDTYRAFERTFAAAPHAPRP